MSSEFPDVWRWLQSLTPLQRVQALSLTNEVVATVIINLVYYERKEGKRVSKREEERRREKKREEEDEETNKQNLVLYTVVEATSMNPPRF